MKNKLGILTVLMAILLVGIASAATTWVTPAANGAVISGNYIFNISQTGSFGSAESADNWNCTVVLASTITGSSYTIILRNTSLNVSVNTTNSGRVYDAADYTLSGSCSNGTASATLTTLTGLIVDTTAPSSCTWTETSSTSYKPDQTWHVSGINVSSAVIKFGTNQQATMTTVTDGATGSFTYSDDVPEKYYTTVTATISDGYNTTDCSLTGITIDSKQNAKQLATVMAAQKEADAANAGPLSPIVILALLAGLGFYFTRKK